MMGEAPMAYSFDKESWAIFQRHMEYANFLYTNSANSKRYINQIAKLLGKPIVPNKVIPMGEPFNAYTAPWLATSAATKFVMQGTYGKTQPIQKEKTVKTYEAITTFPPEPPCSTRVVDRFGCGWMRTPEGWNMYVNSMGHPMCMDIHNGIQWEDFLTKRGPVTEKEFMQNVQDDEEFEFTVRRYGRNGSTHFTQYDTRGEADIAAQNAVDNGMFARVSIVRHGTKVMAGWNKDGLNT